jgi:nitrogen fixation NifU-like protein
MEQPDSYARVTGPCGDTMEFSLKIQDNKIIDSRFQVNGCAVSRACASIDADLAKGKDVEEAWDIDQKTILQYFQQIPTEERHCALLAQNTLRQALENFIKSKEKRD